jgi:putative zinc finger protein
MNTDGFPHDLELLAAHLEDRLDGAEKERLTLHLAGCAECRATLATLARSADLLPRPASAVPASRLGWRLPGSAWLPLAATLVVAIATLTRLGWWVPSDEGPRVAVVASPATPRQTAAPSPAERSAPRPEQPSPSFSRTEATPSGAIPPAEDILVLRGAQRRVAGKTFRLVFGEWVDADFDSVALLPEIDVSSAEERAALLARLPALAPYAALGERVRVVHDGTVYRFRLDSR